MRLDPQLRDAPHRCHKLASSSNSACSHELQTCAFSPMPLSRHFWNNVVGPVQILRHTL
jgi:hypothetical protein